MSSPVAQPTAYPDLNRLLAELLANVRDLLGEQFVGFYLFGSLAAGDFNPASSDIDFLVVTAGTLPADLLPTLAQMHARLTAAGSPWAKKLEGSYIPQAALRRYDPTQADYPALRVDGTFAVDGHGSDRAIQRHLIREQGLTLAGPPPASLIDPVAPAAIRWAARATLHEWWQPQLVETFRLASREYQAYAVLTMCRAFYTLVHADVVSKPVAARWAQATLDARWSPLIARALAWPTGDQPDELDATLALIRYILARAETLAPPPDESL